MAHLKIPKSMKLGLKIFGICVGLVTMLNSAHASIKGNLPVSTISDEFPSTYQSYIDKLKQIYPNATFKAVYTGLDWNLVLKHESYEVKKGISLVPSSYSAEWKKDGKNIYMDGNFVVASKSAVAYVLDPRNSLYEREIFQFEGLSYNPNITVEVVEKVIVSSPMVGAYAKKYKKVGEWIDMDMSYAEIINKVGEQKGVSSVYIASRMIQETSGDIVNNGSINGSNSTYPGIYNFFNINSTPNADGSGSVVNGLKYAKSQGWTTPYLSIFGGVEEIKSSYIKYGQDTVYFQKFDVNNPYGNATALMAYQYQTNILAPRSESRISYAAYSKLKMLDTAFTFYIPVYNNMPEDPVPYPAGDGAKFEEDNTKVYLDDITDNGKETFNIRSSANSELNNVIYTITETSNNLDERTILTRTKKGNGYDWDYVEVKIEDKIIKGYVWKDYVQPYEYSKVENITLDKTEAIIEVGDKLTLIATVLPETARFKDIIWTSSDNNILKVENGEILGVGLGTATVTATTEDQGKVAVAQVTVKEKSQDIILDKEEYTVEIEQQITPQITLKNIDTYTLEVVDTNIAIVENNSIKGLTEGETIIKIFGTGTDIVKEVKLIVTPKEYKIILGKEEYAVREGQTLTPEVTLKNIDAFTMEVTDAQIAAVEGNLIKGLKVGETILRVIGTGTDIVKEVKLIVLPNESYAIDESIIDTENVLTNISTGTTAETILSKITVEGLMVKITNDSGTELEKENFVGTGSKIIFIRGDSSIFCQKEVLIRGDVTGDGLINSADLLKIVKYLKGTATLNATAADATRDNLVNSADLLKIVKHLKGTSLIDFK